MTLFGLTPPPDMRAALRAKLIECSLPTEAVDQVADLAVLAVTEALATIDRTAARANSLSAQITILSIALSAAEAMFRQHSAALAATARETDMRVVETTVSMPGYRS